MVSGTKDALLYESLQNLNLESEFNYYVSTASLMWPVGSALSGVLGSAIVSYTGDVRDTFIVSMIPLTLALIASFFISETSQQFINQKEEEKSNLHPFNIDSVAEISKTCTSCRVRNGKLRVLRNDSSISRCFSRAQRCERDRYRYVGLGPIRSVLLGYAARTTPCVRSCLGSCHRARMCMHGVCLHCSRILVRTAHHIILSSRCICVGCTVASGEDSDQRCCTVLLKSHCDLDTIASEKGWCLNRDRTRIPKPWIARTTSTRHFPCSVLLLLRTLCRYSFCNIYSYDYLFIIITIIIITTFLNPTL